MIGEEHWQASPSDGERKAKSEFCQFVIVNLLLDKRVCWVPVERIGCCAPPALAQVFGCPFPSPESCAKTQLWQRSRPWCLGRSRRLRRGYRGNRQQ
eukprot:2780445-Pleurochrysis_carterae.AAC.1